MALRALLTKPDVSHRGPYYRFNNVTVTPMSIQKPCPPIMLSSWGSPIGMRRVARLGDGWVASAWHSTPEEFRSALGTLDLALTKRGREVDSFPNAVNTMFMYVHEDGMQAKKLAVPIIERATGTSFDADSGHYLNQSQGGNYILQRWQR